ncbi:RNA-directed DNA polymerase from mobile element jockey-like [Pitangus sulphuratus]|nr:RNA-directed DNA polymerase from mobile element jockey-like [Pitangus sulphuratus]
MSTLFLLLPPTLHTDNDVIWTPELDAALTVGSHQSRIEGQNALPQPAGHVAFDAAQDPIGFLGYSVPNSETIQYFHMPHREAQPRTRASDVTQVPDKDGHLRNRDIDKAEVFNAFSVSVFNVDDRLRVSQCPELEDHNCKNDQLPVDSAIVQDLLLQMDPYRSMGPDGIHPKILEELADVIAKPLSMIFEQSWESREVPAEWKLESIVLIFKKGKNEDPRNYRPVSLTSVPGKVMERIIVGRIETHLKGNTVIGHSQHGFRGRKSCLSSLISFYDKVTHLTDQGKPIDVIFLDFSKVFDTLTGSFWVKYPAHSWINTSCGG